MATRKAELYDEDFYEWTRDQAAALHRLAADPAIRYSLPNHLDWTPIPCEERTRGVKYIPVIAPTPYPRGLNE